MEFAVLTHPETTDVVIRWDESAPKPPDLIAAALAAGFNELEIHESPLGVLEEDFALGVISFPRGARALIGINGTTLIEAD